MVFTDERELLNNIYSGFYYGTNNINVDYGVANEAFSLGIGDSLHIFGNFAKSITVTNK